MSHGHNRREFMKTFLAAPLVPYLSGIAAPRAAVGAGPVGGKIPPKAKVILESFDYGGVRLREGRLKRQYQETRDFYYNLPDDNILKGFRERAGRPAPGEHFGGWYGADVFNTFGQWLSGMARMSKAAGDQAMREKATRLLGEWAKTIEPDGFFYYSRRPNAPHYTYEKTVCGLVDLYEFAGVKEALPPLERITDWAVKNLDRARVNPKKGAEAGVGGCEWYTLSENLYRAYLLTGNEKFRTFGDLWRYPAYWGMFAGSAEPTPYGLHAYSHCNTLSGAGMTYAVTGDPEYLKTIVNAFDWFERTQLYPTGGYGPDESLRPPDGSLGDMLETTGASFETPCGSWAGFKLGRYLMTFTGEARYGDWIEKLVYNGIGAALPMTDGGRTFYYADYRIGGGRKVFYSEPFPCCSGTYIQGVADYHNLIYFKDAAGLYVNLYVPSDVTWRQGGQEIKVEQDTDYPEGETTRLIVRPQKPLAFDLKFRVPRWSKGVAVRVNDAPTPVAAEPGSWAVIRRTWNPGDRIVIQIPQPLSLVPIDKQHPRRVALTRGPVVLVRKPESLGIRAGEDLSKWLTRQGDTAEFKARSESAAACVPFYRLNHNEPYAMYFDLEG